MMWILKCGRYPVIGLIACHYPATNQGTWNPQWQVYIYIHTYNSAVISVKSSNHLWDQYSFFSSYYLIGMITDSQDFSSEFSWPSESLGMTPWPVIHWNIHGKTWEWLLACFFAKSTCMSPTPLWMSPTCMMCLEYLMFSYFVDAYSYFSWIC